MLKAMKYSPEAGGGMDPIVAIVWGFLGNCFLEHTDLWSRRRPALTNDIARECRDRDSRLAGSDLAAICIVRSQGQTSLLSSEDTNTHTLQEKTSGVSGALACAVISPDVNMIYYRRRCVS